MPCASCRERAELLKRAREAYQRGDMPEAQRLLKEMFGTVVKDVDKHVSVVIHGLLSNKPK
jgi:hypothetical protein